MLSDTGKLRSVRLIRRSHRSMFLGLEERQSEVVGSRPPAGWTAQPGGVIACGLGPACIGVCGDPAESWNRVARAVSPESARSVAVACCILKGKLRS